VPDLPLHYDAVGTEMSDGKFNPIMFLTTPIPRDGYKKPLLTIDLKSGAPKIKIFRGTNDLANNNYFLGEFEIVNYPKTKQSMQLMLFFSVDEKKRLFLQARDVDETHNTALKLKRLSK
jgi:molecular chaperone DnaK (HSP70)